MGTFEIVTCLDGTFDTGVPSEGESPVNVSTMEKAIARYSTYSPRPCHLIVGPARFELVRIR